MEGLCLEARIILEVSENVFGCTIDTLNTVGGGARSAVWQQIKADITGREIEIPEVEEATPLGSGAFGRDRCRNLYRSDGRIQENL